MSFHPEIRRALSVLEDLQECAQKRANIITCPEYCWESEEERALRQARAQSTADAYAFCKMLLRELDI